MYVCFSQAMACPEGYEPLSREELLKSLEKPLSAGEFAVLRGVFTTVCVSMYYTSFLRTRPAIIPQFETPL